MNQSEVRQGLFHLGRLAVSALAIFFCLVALKFFTQDRLALKNFGLGGALSQPKLDLLLIGSSHTRKSYDMRVLEKDTGITDSFQISYDGTDLSTISQMLDYLVTRADHSPRYLVVEAYTAYLASKPDLRDPRYFFDAPPSLKMAILRCYASQRGDRSSIQDLLDLVVNRGNDEIVTYPFYAPIAERGSYKGGRTDFYFPGLSPEEFRKLKAGPVGNVPNPAQLAALDHIIDVARSHRISVIFIDPPLPQPISSNPNIQLLKKDFGRILSARQVPYIDGDQLVPIDDPALFSDNNHMSSKGREVFTPIISARLKSWMASQPGSFR